MARRSYRPERIIGKLMEAEVLLQSGSPSAIGVKVLKPCSVLALSPIFGQEDPT